MQPPRGRCDALLERDARAVGRQRRTLDTVAEYARRAAINVPLDQVRGAAGSERRKESITVLCERHAPEIEVNRLEGLALASDGKLLEIGDRFAVRHVHQRCPG